MTREVRGRRVRSSKVNAERMCVVELEIKEKQRRSVVPRDGAGRVMDGNDSRPFFLFQTSPVQAFSLSLSSIFVLFTGSFFFHFTESESTSLC